jgi:gamma-glutamyltranspeptidase / glutathione hydrolase
VLVGGEAVLGACGHEQRHAFRERSRSVLDLEHATALQHDVDLVLVVRLLPVRLRRDEDVDAELEARRAVDDLVAATMLDERTPRRVDVEWMCLLSHPGQSSCPLCDAPPVELDLDALFEAGRASTSGWRRMPAVATDAMVATSHPIATRAGLRAIEAGGNAVDAALAAAAVLTVAEPTDNGVGGDAFALVWDGEALHGLNGSGRSPAELDDVEADDTGPRSVTVPGAVRLWADLAARFGKLELGGAVGAAADLAERGLACTARIADKWGRAPFAPWPAPRLGERYRLPELAVTLRRIAAEGPSALYGGEIASAIAAATWLSEDDLLAHRSEWVEPLRRRYRDVEVCELPPNGQGVAALLALALYEGLEPGVHSEIEAMKLAFADARAVVHDGPLPADLFDTERLAALRALVRADCALDVSLELQPGGTTYLCAVDGDGMAVSLIQSLYGSFGSGVLAPGTGIVLQNRASGFTRAAGHPNALGPAKRPFHTIIPGMLLAEGGLLGPFGVMGGPMQPQGHFQVVRRIVDDGDDPQAALDAPRWRVEDDGHVELEPALAPLAPDLRAKGHDVRIAAFQHPFGVGQVILRRGEALIGGSDGRGDGYAAGI